MGMMRLDKYLADMGLGTRSQVKKLLKKGSVSVNGEVAGKPEMKIDQEKDQVSVNGTRIQYETLEYYLLNKPAGVVSATEDKRDKTVLDCIDSRKRKDLFPVGRLDKDTEGLLIITNDGELAHRLLSPKKHVEKTYYVELEKPLDEKARDELESGVDIGEKAITMPARLTDFVPGCRNCRITICEGKFHQVKRMFHAVGNEVVYLKRMSMGTLKLDENLKPGEYRILTEEEIERLRNNA